jgi:lipooligosaccharide transport system ATP-binding protein
MESCIEAQKLEKRFGPVCAVEEFSFSVKRGATFAILGENGAGKSTTMRMLACRSLPTSGTLIVEGLNTVGHGRAIRGMIGVIPQDNNLDPDLNVLENLCVYARYFKIPRGEAERRARDLLSFVNLERRVSEKVDHLSGGMKRRLVIARSLIHQPKILLMDEPTTGLDPHVRQEIWEKLEELSSKQNITIVLSTHYMDEAERLSSAVVLMARGRQIASGTSRELIERNARNFTLEVRDALDIDLAQVGHKVEAKRRGNAHTYFADSAELLTPLMSRFGSRPVVLRRSNLEDVFLKLIVN